MNLARGVEKVAGLPFFLVGTVVKGFGRGSKQLANLPTDTYDDLLSKIPTGVYYGFASVNKGPIYKMAMSIGWNPFFKNTKKTIVSGIVDVFYQSLKEIHIMHKFNEDFYGQELRAIALGYIRPEADFKSLDELIQAIQEDINFSNDKLSLPENSSFKTHEWFTNENKL